MKIKTNGVEYLCAGYRPSALSVTFTVPDGSPDTLGDHIDLITNNGVLLNTVTVSNYARRVDGDGTLTLTNAPEPEEPAPDLDVMKADKIADSKTQLAAYLLAHPMTWTDGKQYSVTAEKQSLLTSQLALYSVATASGQTYQLRWNATGGECTEWTYENMAALALAIGAYVQPFVSYQQEREVAINSCTTVEEAEAITIDYTSVTA